MVTANVQLTRDTINHNYQSAVGQSGIFAGDSGFNIIVSGNTLLKGGEPRGRVLPLFGLLRLHFFRVRLFRLAVKAYGYPHKNLKGHLFKPRQPPDRSVSVFWRLLRGRGGCLCYPGLVFWSCPRPIDYFHQERLCTLGARF
jgi:hypothetical protein